LVRKQIRWQCTESIRGTGGYGKVRKQISQIWYIDSADHQGRDADHFALIRWLDSPGAFSRDDSSQITQITASNAFCRERLSGPDMTGAHDLL